MTDKTILIPTVPSDLTAHDIAIILWEHGIAKVSSLYLVPVPYDTKFNSAYIIISNHETNLHPIVNSILEKDEPVMIELKDETLTLLNDRTIEVSSDPLRETNEFQYNNSDEALMLHNDGNKYLTKFSESYFEDIPRTMFIFSSLNS
jgi:hypothetical protein